MESCGCGQGSGAGGRGPGALLIVLLGLIPHPALADLDKPVVRKTAHFVVYGWSSAYLLAERASVRAEISYADLSRELGLTASPSRRIPVVIYRTHAEFTTATSRGRRSTVVGEAEYGAERVDVDGSELYRPMEEVLDHEIAHIVVGRVLGPRAGALPRWMNEGIATHFAHEEDAATIALLSDAVTENRLIPLASLSGAFDRAKASGLAYAQSGSIVAHLESEHRRGASSRTLAAIAGGASFEQAIRTVTGVPTESVYSAWEKKLYKTYGGPWFIRHLSETVWSMMALLAIAAFSAMVHKKRVAARRYEEEEYFARHWPPD